MITFDRIRVSQLIWKSKENAKYYMYMRIFTDIKKPDLIFRSISS